MFICHVASPCDVCRVYSIGDDATEIFFVDEGAMEIVWEDVRIPKNKRIQHKVTKVDETQSLGEEGLLTADNETLQHVFTGIATRMSTLFYIDRAATNRLLCYHPKVKARCQVLVAQKLNRWQVQLQLVLKEYLEELAASSGSGGGEFGKSVHEYLLRTKFVCNSFGLSLSLCLSLLYANLVWSRYEPKGLLPVPVFSQCGRLVDSKKESEAMKRSSDAETAGQNEGPVQPTAETEEGTVAALRADVQRLEAKLDRALDALM